MGGGGHHPLAHSHNPPHQVDPGPDGQVRELAPLAGPGLGCSWLWLVLRRRRTSNIQWDSVILHDRWKTTHSVNSSDSRGFIRPPGEDDFYGDESCWCLAVCSVWRVLHFPPQPGENVTEFWQFPTKLSAEIFDKEQLQRSTCPARNEPGG